MLMTVLIFYQPHEKLMLHFRPTKFTLLNLIISLITCTLHQKHKKDPKKKHKAKEKTNKNKNKGKGKGS